MRRARLNEGLDLFSPALFTPPTNAERRLTQLAGKAIGNAKADMIAVGATELPRSWRCEAPTRRAALEVRRGYGAN
jgi:hypothetical protein